MSSKHRKSLSEFKKLKKEAELSFAYEAYRGLLSRTLGIHHWLVGDWESAIVSSLGILLVLAGIILANTNVIDKTHKQFCCCKLYP